MENKGTTFALYKKTYNSDGAMKNEELTGNFHEFHDAVATAALIVHNQTNQCIGSYGEIPEDSYRYFIYEMDSNGDIDLTQPLYKTEIYSDNIRLTF